jgi:predicted RNase H-like nuclease
VNPESTHVEVTSARSFESVVERFEAADAIAVDIPIGLPAWAPWRRAEVDARLVVHPSTVFATYPRPIYECTTHQEAVALCREKSWPRISRQSYGLWRLSEVEPFAERVYEVHPEVSFWKMNRETRLQASKHTWNGFFERRRLLERASSVSTRVFLPIPRLGTYWMPERRHGPRDGSPCACARSFRVTLSPERRRSHTDRRRPWVQA